MLGSRLIVLLFITLTERVLKEVSTVTRSTCSTAITSTGSHDVDSTTTGTGAEAVRQRTTTVCMHASVRLHATDRHDSTDSTGQHVPSIVVRGATVRSLAQGKQADHRIR